MIKAAIRFGDNMVMVFDENGQQMTEYQGKYEAVKDEILKDAPGTATFYYSVGGTAFAPIGREEW